jgi:hypothetical protein
LHDLDRNVRYQLPAAAAFALREAVEKGRTPLPNFVVHRLIRGGLLERFRKTLKVETTTRQGRDY